MRTTSKMFQPMMSIFHKKAAQTPAPADQPGQTVPAAAPTAPETHARDQARKSRNRFFLSHKKRSNEEPPAVREPSARQAGKARATAAGLDVATSRSPHRSPHSVWRTTLSSRACSNRSNRFPPVRTRRTCRMRAPTRKSIRRRRRRGTRTQAGMSAPRAMSNRPTGKSEACRAVGQGGRAGGTEEARRRSRERAEARPRSQRPGCAPGGRVDRNLARASPQLR